MAASDNISWSSTRGSGSRAFTLVELLVVVAIIALLISMVLPAVNKAKDSAYRVACMSQLHQLLLTQSRYAGDNRQKVTPHCGWDTTNIFPTSFKSNPWVGLGAVDGWTGLGLLWRFGYLTEPRLMWCPASKNPKLPFEYVPGTAYKDFYGWRPAPPAGGARWMAQPTMQRFFVTKLQSSEHPSSTSFYADAFFSGGFANGPAVNYYHKIGYSVARLDGSTFFFVDEDQQIADQAIPMGAKNNSKFQTIQESVFINYFDR